MKNKAVGLLLLVSIVFNVFFVIAYVRSRRSIPMGMGFEQRARRVAQRLNLDESQRQAFEALLAQTLQERDKIREENSPQHELLLAELIKDEPDEQVLRGFVNNDRTQQRRELRLQHMKRLMAMLKPEQRRALAEMIRCRWKK